MSRHKLRQLRSLLQSPQWRADSIQHASRYTQYRTPFIITRRKGICSRVCVFLLRAVSSLGLWVAALLDYHHARDIVKPFQDQLATAEEILTKVRATLPITVCSFFLHTQAEMTLVTRERDMLETKVEFRAAQKERNNIRRQKTAIETKIAVSFTLLILYFTST